MNIRLYLLTLSLLLLASWFKPLLLGIHKFRNAMSSWKIDIFIIVKCFYLYPVLFFALEYAVAAAKSLQSCPTLCDPIDGSPPGSPISGILQARTQEWVSYSILCIISTPGFLWLKFPFCFLSLTFPFFNSIKINFIYLFIYFSWDRVAL